MDDVKLYPETKLLLDTKLVNEPKPSLLEKLLVDKQAAIGSETKRSEMKNLSTVMQQKTILFDDIPSLKSSMEMKSSSIVIVYF